MSKSEIHEYAEKRVEEKMLNRTDTPPFYYIIAHEDIRTDPVFKLAVEMFFEGRNSVEAERQ